MDNRKEALTKLCAELDNAAKTTIEPLIDDIVFIESQLQELKKYPFIKVNPKDPTQQKPTPAAKQYKELLQQYNNCIKIFLGVLSTVEKAESSPLRDYLNRMRAGANV